MYPGTPSTVVPCARAGPSISRVKGTTIEVDECSETCEQHGVALFPESLGEGFFGAHGLASDHGGDLSSPLGRMQGPAPGVTWVVAQLAESCGAEDLGNALDVHRVGPEIACELPDSLAGLGSDEPEQCSLRCGELQVGKLGLPGSTACPMRHAEKEPETQWGHVGSGV